MIQLSPKVIFRIFFHSNIIAIDFPSIGLGLF